MKGGGKERDLGQCGKKFQACQIFLHLLIQARDSKGGEKGGVLKR